MFSWKCLRRSYKADFWFCIRVWSQKENCKLSYASSNLARTSIVLDEGIEDWIEIDLLNRKVSTVLNGSGDILKTIKFFIMIDQKCIQEIKTICSNFLKEHGGMLNGYSTYIEGATDINSSFVVELPNNDTLTRAQIRNISNELKKEILNYLVQNNLNVIIRFIPKHIEHGCFNTYIEFVYPAGRLF